MPGGRSVILLELFLGFGVKGRVRWTFGANIPRGKLGSALPGRSFYVSQLSVKIDFFEVTITGTSFLSRQMLWVG